MTARSRIMKTGCFNPVFYVSALDCVREQTKPLSNEFLFFYKKLQPFVLQNGYKLK